MRPIRCLSPRADEKPLYLTFDDGPVSEGTPQVLDVLAEQGARATFFVVANRARQERGLLRRIVDEGHAVGNHSLDHGYRAFFSGTQKMKQWIQDSESALSDLLGKPTIGFRPPNGIQTPELHRALRELAMPLILWNVRYYDTLFTWTRARALRSVAGTAPGSIVLLHDRQKPAKLPLFLDALSAYSREIEKQGFVLKALSLNQETP
jgi:peptidoglycan/xylan/chitin deacetylase (PgdA/CDA1 family)